jgi:hypothetical protein
VGRNRYHAETRIRSLQTEKRCQAYLFVPIPLQIKKNHVRAQLLRLEEYFFYSDRFSHGGNVIDCLEYATPAFASYKRVISE